MYVFHAGIRDDHLVALTGLMFNILTSLQLDCQYFEYQSGTMVWLWLLA